MTAAAILRSTILRKTAAVLIALALAGCLSEHPVGKPDPQINDSRLLGKWRSEGENFPPFDQGQSVWLVTAISDGTLQIDRQNRKGQMHEGSQPTIAHVTRLASGDYLNLQVEQRQYLIAKYALEGGDRLSLRFVDWNSLTNAINEQALPGVLKEEGSKTVPYVTATAAQWQEFLASAPPDLFGKSWTLVRPEPETSVE
jgi:hypothetical protein